LKIRPFVAAYLDGARGNCAELPRLLAAWSFGQATTANGFGGKPPRQIQLGLKFVFELKK